MIDLSLIWAIVLSVVVILYVILDGFDLGIGILFPFAKSTEYRDIMMSTVSPVWDGNETWLVLGAAFLYGAFPKAYSILLTTLYLPITVMLAALIFRGVAFEFRFKAIKSRFLWDFSFTYGSVLAAFCQGVILGSFVIGFINIDSDTPSTLRVLTPFSFMTGCAVVAGYALLGATWLIKRTLGDLQILMFRTAKRLLIIIAIAMMIVSIWTPLAVPEIWNRWFQYPRIIYLSILPLLTGCAFLLHIYMLRKRHESMPFYLTIALFILGYIGFCISDWPYIVPRAITIWDAAAPPSTQIFLIIGAAILIPILLGYTFYAYHVFRGKVTSADHHYE